MTTPALVSVEKLRRIAAALEAGRVPNPGDGAWLASRLRNYLEGAERGLTVDVALDLSPLPGAAAWWTNEGIERRDAALRDLAARFFAGRKVASQAYEIHHMALRYATSAWRFDRDRDAMPSRYGGTKSELLWAAFMSGAPMPLGKRQLQTILAVDRRSAAA